MDNLIQLSFYISVFSAGLLVLLLILSIIGGMDLDFDIGDTEIDTDTGFGGLGIIKSGLTFLSIGAWVVKIMLALSVHPFLTIGAGIVAGVAAVFILSWFLKLLLRNQSYVNWEFYEAEGKTGKVYLKIPEDGTGIINIEINGVNREMKALSLEKVEIETGSKILVNKVDDDVAQVSEIE